MSQAAVGPPDREHLVQLNANQVEILRGWLEWPNGSLRINDRLVLNAVVGGGILVRTDPYRYPEARG